MLLCISVPITGSLPPRSYVLDTGPEWALHFLQVRMLPSNRLNQLTIDQYLPPFPCHDCVKISRLSMFLWTSFIWSIEIDTDG